MNVSRQNRSHRKSSSSYEQQETIDYRWIRLFAEDSVFKEVRFTKKKNKTAPHAHIDACTHARYLLVLQHATRTQVLTCFPARTSHSTDPAHRDTLHSSGSGYIAAPSPWIPGK